VSCPQPDILVDFAGLLSPVAGSAGGARRYHLGSAPARPPACDVRIGADPRVAGGRLRPAGP